VLGVKLAAQDNSLDASFLGMTTEYFYLQYYFTFKMAAFVSPEGGNCLSRESGNCHSRESGNCHCHENEFSYRESGIA
jgi:hypothetical protein